LPLKGGVTNHEYDIFERLPNGTDIWKAFVVGLEEAHRDSASRATHAWKATAIFCTRSAQSHAANAIMAHAVGTILGLAVVVLLYWKPTTHSSEMN